MMLDDILLTVRQNVIFQQDGVLAHNAHIVRDYLNAKFKNRWLGTYGLRIIQWSPRSPDLTPQNFLLWSHLKTIVYADPPINLRNLKDKMTAATSKEFMRHVESCFVYGGQQFEQFIKN